MIDSSGPRGAAALRAARLRVAGVSAAGLAAVTTVGVLDPGTPGHYPGCPLLAVTGWYCPGCGGLRAVHALTHGDPGAAFGYNPLLVTLLPALAALYAAWAWRAATGRPPWSPSGRTRRRLLLAVLVLLPAFWLYRNLPAGAWAAP